MLRSGNLPAKQVAVLRGFRVPPTCEIRSRAVLVALDDCHDGRLVQDLEKVIDTLRTGEAIQRYGYPITSGGDPDIAFNEIGPLTGLRGEVGTGSHGHATESAFE